MSNGEKKIRSLNSRELLGISEENEKSLKCSTDFAIFAPVAMAVTHPFGEVCAQKSRSSSIGENTCRVYIRGHKRISQFLLIVNSAKFRCGAWKNGTI